MRGGESEEFRITPESLGLSRATKTHIPWKDRADESRQILCALTGKEEPIRELILYNAALRLWVADEGAPLARGLDKADAVLKSGAILGLLDRLRERVAAPR